MPTRGVSHASWNVSRSHTAGCTQFLVKLQAERPEFRWKDKLAAARKADSAKRRRARAKTGSKAATRSMLLAEQRSEAALAELARVPSVCSSQPGTEVWIAWRQWRAYVQYQQQLRSSAAGRKDASHYQEPVSLERSLESELIQAANEAVDSKLGPSVAGNPTPRSVDRMNLPPGGVPSLSASRVARTESHVLLETRVQTSTGAGAASPRSAALVASGPISSPSRSLQAGAGSQSYRLLRRSWQAWRDWLYSIALEQLALMESSGAESTEDIANAVKAAVPISPASSAAPLVEPRLFNNAPQVSQDDWNIACENLQRCGRRRSHSFKATSHAHFLMHRARTRSTSNAELKFLAEQKGRYNRK